MLRPPPFTIKYTQVQVGLDGSGRYARESYLSRRSDGITVESAMERAADGRDYLMRTMRNPLSGERIVLDAATESKTTYRLSPSAIRELTNPPRDCGSDQPNAQASILGHRVVRTVLKVPDPQRHRHEAWRAPELGCEILRYTLFGIGPAGKEIEIMTREAVSVTLGEPDPAAFNVPSYPERSPSEVLALYANKFHLAPLSNAAGLDRAYRPKLQPVP